MRIKSGLQLKDRMRPAIADVAKLFCAQAEQGRGDPCADCMSQAAHTISLFLAALPDGNCDLGLLKQAVKTAALH